MEQELEVQGFDFSKLGARAAATQEKAREYKRWKRKTIDQMQIWGDYFNELRLEFGPRGDGFKEVIEQGFGELYSTVAYWMRKSREPNQFNIELIGAPEQARIPEQAQSTHEQDEKDRKLAELEEKVRIANERLFSVESQVAHYKEQSVIAQGQVAHYKQQATIAQGQVTQTPKIVEKRVEVTPQHMIDRQRELQAQKTQLQVQVEQIKKERDLYKRDLMKEREADNDRFSARTGANRR